MITDDDAQLHEPTSGDPLWGETNYFGLYLPDVPFNIGVYALFRTNTGVVNTNVSVNSGLRTMPWAADYWDAWGQAAMPAQTDLLNYELANGLRVRSDKPNHVWDVDYEAGPVSLHFRYTALMEPYDINDPDQDPMVRAKAEGSDFTWGHAYAGHFDQTGRYEGELVMDGRRFEIDCVSTMDHSWGVRQERQASVMSWLHAHVDERTFVHAIFDFDPQSGPFSSTPVSLTHGYAVRDGVRYGLAGGEGITQREDFHPMRVALQLRDETGHEYELDGRAQTTFPWQAWPGTVGHNALLKWSLNGQDAWGEAMDFIGLEQLCRVYNGPNGSRP